MLSYDDHTRTFVNLIAALEIHKTTAFQIPHKPGYFLQDIAFRNAENSSHIDTMGGEYFLKMFYKQLLNFDLLICDVTLCMV